LIRSLRQVLFIIKIVIFAGCVLMFYINYGCKDPNEYKPPEDTLQLPPGPPTLIYPPHDTVIWYEDPFPHTVILRWSNVEGAEFYHLQYAADSSMSLGSIMRADNNYYELIFYDNATVYWRARAASSQWQWYTNWSEIRRLSVYYTPGSLVNKIPCKVCR